jgi:hypothetical protein
MHPHTNMPDDGFEVVADNYIEAFAEKFRADDQVGTHRQLSVRRAAVSIRCQRRRFVTRGSLRWRAKAIFGTS